MKTAIIYRSNENLDKNLAELKGKVELFHAFLTEAEEGQIAEVVKNLLLKNGKEKFEKLICDYTIYNSIKQSKWDMKIEIIKQDVGLHEEYIKSIVNEAKEIRKEIVIIKDRLADHCEINGINKYGDTLFLEEVLGVWTSIMISAGVKFKVIKKTTITKSEVEGKIVICDHHSRIYKNLLDLKREEEIILKDAYFSSGLQCDSVEGIKTISITKEVTTKSSWVKA